MVRATWSLLAFSLCLHTACAQAPDYPPFYTEKIFEVPDLIQADERAHFPKDGSAYCGPVATANSLMWLASNGYPNLVPRTGTQFDDEVALAKLLASKTYMDTSLDDGTGIGNFMRGLGKYLQERGVGIDRLEYRGWRKHPRRIGVGHLVAELPWIKQNILGTGCVWLNVGWYKCDASRKEYQRLAGHWVTVVGYGKDEGGGIDPSILILHDPSPRAGRGFVNEYASVTTIEEGVLTGDASGLPRPAAGYPLLGGGMHIKKGATTAIIDGAVALALTPGPGGTLDTGDSRASNPIVQGVNGFSRVDPNVIFSTPPTPVVHVANGGCVKSRS